MPDKRIGEIPEHEVMEALGYHLTSGPVLPAPGPVTKRMKEKLPLESKDGALRRVQGWAIGQGDEGTVRSIAPRDVLDVHRKLREQWQNPAMPLQSYIYGFMKAVRDAAYDQGGNNAVVAAFSDLFWPATSAGAFCNVIAKELFEATTYQVTADMTEAVNATYQNTAKHVVHIEEWELPSEAGFVWFDKPVPAQDVSGTFIFHRAVSWSKQVLQYPNGTTLPGVRMTSWYYAPDRDVHWSPELEEQVGKLGALALSHSQILAFGSRVGGFDGEISMDDFAAWMHTLWMFMDTEIVTHSKPPIERHFRRRAQRTLRHSDVNVVTLRRLHPQGAEPTGVHRSVEWSVRWVVQGHWRHLGAVVDHPAGAHHALPDASRQYCSVCDGKITWVRPYLKGPEGLPLRSTENLFRLSR